MSEKFTAQQDLGKPWVRYEDHHEGEKDYYRDTFASPYEGIVVEDYNDNRGMLAYMYGEFVEVLRKYKGKDTWMYEIKNEEGDTFHISNRQFEEDFGFTKI